MKERMHDQDAALSANETELISRLAGLVPDHDPVREGQVLFLAGQQEASSRLGRQKSRSRWLTAAALLLVSMASGATGWQYGKSGSMDSVAANSSELGITKALPVRSVPEPGDMRLSAVSSEANARPNVDRANGRPTAFGLVSVPQERVHSGQSLDGWIDQLLSRHGTEPCSWRDPLLLNGSDIGPPDNRSVLTQAELRRELLNNDTGRPAL